MIKTLRRVAKAVTTSGPLWLQGWYWAHRLRAAKDRFGTRRQDQDEPNRNIARTVLGRAVRAVWALLGPWGWGCAVSVLAGLSYLFRQLDGGADLVLIGTIVAAVGAGVVWTRRNTVWDFGIVVECECGRDLEDEL